jgi:hypothetical protein
MLCANLGIISFCFECIINMGWYVRILLPHLYVTDCENEGEFNDKLAKRL